MMSVTVSDFILAYPFVNNHIEKGKGVNIQVFCDLAHKIVMMIIAIVVLGGAYLLYGRYLQNKWGIDPNAKTPAYEMEDNG